MGVVPQEAAQRSLNGAIGGFQGFKGRLAHGGNRLEFGILGPKP